jgi:DNA polymerase (family 10)
MDAFTRHSSVRDVIGRGGTKASVRLHEGIQVDLRVVEPEAFGAALVYFTGSKQHNIRIREMAVKKGLKISEYGVWSDATGERVAGATEEDVYATLGLPWMPPELREDAGEIEAAQEHRLPTLVEVGDIRGDLHADADATDGVAGIEALARAARTRGYAYVLVSPRRAATAAATEPVSSDELLAHVERIREAGRRHPDVTLLAGAECDILPDGSMDHPDEVLGRLDLVLGAVQSHVTQTRAEMTERICAALANPYVSLLTHPTGRGLGEGNGYDVDLDQVFWTAARHGKAIEISAAPTRADLSDVHARRAVSLGAFVAVSASAHRPDELGRIELGVGAARRAWIEPSRVINTWPLPKLREWVAGSRSTGARRPGRRP